MKTLTLTVPAGTTITPFRDGVKFTFDGDAARKKWLGEVNIALTDGGANDTIVSEELCSGVVEITPKNGLRYTSTK